MMVMGVCLFAVSTLLFVTTTHPAWFTLFRLLEGIGAAAMGPASQAFLADITTDDTRSRAYGWLTTAQFGGLIAGPALAGPPRRSAAAASGASTPSSCSAARSRPSRPWRS